MKTFFMGKFLISAALALAAGWWTTYLFEPTSDLWRDILYVIPVIAFAMGYIYDVTRKRADVSLLPPVLAKLVRLERRALSLQDTLKRLSSKELRELGKIFAGNASEGDTSIHRVPIHRLRQTSRWRTVLRFALLNLAVGSVLLFVHALGVWFFLPAKHDLTEIAQLVQMHLSKDDQGSIQFGGVINDLYAPGERIPPAVKRALVAREDQRFYSHWGFDWRGKARAVVRSSMYILTLGQRGRIQGGSTLTEQLAKNLFLSGARGLFSGLRRKFKERILALKLEAFYTKDEILEMYLNRVYFGRGAYGIETAARLFFNVQPENLPDLNLYQAAMLVQSLPGPGAYNCSRNPERAARETWKLLEQMGQPVDPTRLRSTVMRCQYNGKRRLIKPEHRYLRDWIVSELTKAAYVDDLHGDFVVVTTMNARMQRFAAEAIDTGLQRFVNRGVFQGSNLPQAALVALTPQGAVRAIMGGRDYAESQFSRITQAQRQPGSTFKLFVYLTALEQGRVKTISDQPDDQGWPSNGSHGYSSTPVTLTEAFQNSRNAAAVNLLRKVGIVAVLNTARRLGVAPKLPAKPGLSLALGAYETTPLEMTGAYAVLANQGREVRPHGIRLARTNSGATRYAQHTPHRRIVDKRVVANINQMLRAVVVKGTGKRAQFGSYIVGGKTGTTQGNTDAWFIGCTRYLCTGVWVGCDQGQSMPAAVWGGSLPAEIFQNFMDKTHRAMQWLPEQKIAAR